LNPPSSPGVESANGNSYRYDFGRSIQDGLDDALESALQPSGFSLSDNDSKILLAAEKNIKWEKDFWTDFAPLAPILATNGISLNLLVQNSDPRDIYRAQVFGRVVLRNNGFESEWDLEIALRLEKRRRKGQFFVVTSDYNAKPLLDIYFEKIHNELPDYSPPNNHSHWNLRFRN